MSRFKVLMGVQGYGNGHITNCNIMADALRGEGADVTVLLSGRTPDKLPSMDKLSPYELRGGLGFVEDEAGRVLMLRSIFNKQVPTAIRDVARLNLANYDFVLSNYEATTAWSALLRGVDSAAVNHQSAFLYDVPTPYFNRLAGRFYGTMVINAPAPVKKAVGLHFDSFGQPLLPPIVNPPRAAAQSDPRKIVAYFNFENPLAIADMLQPFKDYRFHLYSKAIAEPGEHGNVIFKKPSPDFREDLRDCAGLIGNAGFETPSELLIMGKKMLVKPQTGQWEQAANARALRQLGYADTMETLDPGAIARWLDKESCFQIDFPNVAAAAAQWIVSGADKSRIRTMSDELWHRTVRRECAVPR